MSGQDGDVSSGPKQNADVAAQFLSCNFGVRCVGAGLHDHDRLSRLLLREQSAGTNPCRGGGRGGGAEKTAAGEMACWMEDHSLS